MKFDVPEFEEPQFSVEESSCFDSRLTVAVEVPCGWEASGEEMARQIATSPVLRRVSGGTAEIRVVLLPARGRTGKGDPAPRLPGALALKEATWVVLQPGGEILLPPFPVEGEAAARHVAQNLENIARYRQILGLRNPESGLTGLVGLTVRRRGNNGEWVEVPDPLGKGLQEGEAISIEIFNSHSKSLFAYLLNFGLSGQIQVIFPLAGEELALNSRSSLQLGAREGDEMRLFLPDVSRTDSPRRDHCVDTLKLFVSTHPLDLGLLDQDRSWEDQKSPERSETPVLESHRFVLHEAARDWMTVERKIIVSPAVHHRSKSPISRPPGWGLRRFAEFCFSKKTYAQVLEPALSDMQKEHFDALAAGRPLKARMALVRGYWSFWSAVVAQLPLSLARRVYEVWKTTKTGS